ncbi:hypothetical protein BCF59_0268 [Mycoplasmopsis mustelae]|uniref:Uncharacterized protein n=1 Tax=Mycoplasmopsis mustelae TaxID=171289 RepID=A0A4R7UD17_9BACT|nr:hypothetical protein [Mycoplasmopsis mustelae]TDV24309.1 hypothetical protein BCF59_0268 [Mycoplasmopsis mustelae]
MTLTINNYFQAKQESSNSLDTLKNILSWMAQKGSSINFEVLWVVFFIFLIIAFLIGIWFNWKYLIVKAVIIILTIISAFVSSAILKNIINNDPKLKDYSSLVGSLVTIITILFYLSLSLVCWIVYFIIWIILFFVRFKKPKRKKSKLVRFLVGGLGNVVISIPGSLILFSLFSASENNQKSTSSLTTISNAFTTKIMTANQGDSIAGLGNTILNGILAADELKNLLEIFKLSPQERSKAQTKEVAINIMRIVRFLEDPRFNSLLNLALKRINLTNLFQNLNEEAFEKIKIKIKIKTKVAFSSSLLRNQQKARELITSYIKENTSEVLQQYVIGDSKNIFAFYQSLIKHINPKIASKINTYILNIIKENNELNKYIDVSVVANAILDEIRKHNFYQKTQAKTNITPIEVKNV